MKNPEAYYIPLKYFSYIYYQFIGLIINCTFLPEISPFFQFTLQTLELYDLFPQLDSIARRLSPHSKLL